MAIIEASIPVFFLLFLVELYVAPRRRPSVYRLNDSIDDLHFATSNSVLAKG